MKKKIPAKTTVRLLDRMAFMNSQFGVAFNGMITFNFEQVGVTTDTNATRALTKLNEAVADLIHRHGQRLGADVRLPHLFMYVHEHVQSYGHHVHELLVLPPGLNAIFNQWLKAWARRTFPSVHPDAIEYEGQYHKTDKARAEQQKRLARYVLKSSGDVGITARGGGGTTLHSVLGIDEPNRAYCADMSRVAGSSQNIATRAQYDVGYDWPEWIEDSMTDLHLQEYHRRLRAKELNRMLRSIDT